MSHDELVEAGWHWMDCRTLSEAQDTARKLTAKGVHGFVRGVTIWSKTPFPTMKKLLGKWGPGDEYLSR